MEMRGRASSDGDTGELQSHSIFEFLLYGNYTCPISSLEFLWDTDFFTCKCFFKVQQKNY